MVKNPTNNPKRILSIMVECVYVNIVIEHLKLALSS